MKEELRSLRSLQDGDENVCVGVEFNFAAHALTLELQRCSERCGRRFVNNPGPAQL
jgi:hypothetical protein